MAAVAGILNQQSAAQALTGRAAPLDSGASGSSDSGGASVGSSTISANDFLTLLVTEMQNQDPTTATDPNQYINQLVQVNSLEQLIGINQTLTAAFGAAAAASASSSASPQGTAAMARPEPSQPATAVPGFAQSRQVAGNLSVPAANSAAQRVAHSLDGSMHRAKTANETSR